MQLGAPAEVPALRGRLSAAACVLLAAAAPAVARADSGATNQFDATALFYGENQRTKVVEPVARITRLLADGQSFSAQIALDAITGASPTGAMPSTTVQTITSASGRATTSSVGSLPMNSFSDFRVATELEWQKPLGRFLTATTGGSFSKEKDYQSLGLSEKVSLELMERLTTITAGISADRDRVEPRGGTTAGLADPSVIISRNSSPKYVTSGLLGISRILTRRLMVGVDASKTYESGYLTEPYKLVSLLDGQTGEYTGTLTERRPTTRNRQSILASSVYHLDDDVAYLSYRRYWDDWGLRSNTFDLKYRSEIADSLFVQPHLRYYNQTAADFFVYGMRNDRPLPEFATSDYRLGPLQSFTIGATVGLNIPDTPGEFTIRAEYIRQWGVGFPQSAIGAQKGVDLFPALDIGSVVLGYSLGF